MGKYNRYDDEFKQNLVNLYQSGKTQTDIAKEYGVSDSALTRWVKQFSEVRLNDDQILTVQQIKQLQKRNAKLEEENLILQKSNCHIHASNEVRMNAVHTLRNEHVISTLCRVLQVNRSSYYKHFYGPTAPRTLLNQQLRQLIFKIYHDNDLRLGVAKITQLIKVEYGLSVSTGHIYRLMKTMNLPQMSTRKPLFKYQTTSEALPLPNQLQQKFSCHHPNTTWTSDMTYIHTDQGFVYLCVVLDLFARKIVSWQVATKMDQNLILSTFQKAVTYRQPDENLLMHTDRGSQYLAHDVRQFLDQHHMTHSYSKPGYPWDNAVTEAFFKYLKQEELSRRHFKNLIKVKQAVFQYIEGFYNPRRPHSANNLLAPDQKEAKYFSESN